jgi:hypothetical protein
MEAKKVGKYWADVRNSEHEGPEGLFLTAWWFLSD